MSEHDDTPKKSKVAAMKQSIANGKQAVGEAKDTAVRTTHKGIYALGLLTLVTASELVWKIPSTIAESVPELTGKLITGRAHHNDFLEGAREWVDNLDSGVETMSFPKLSMDFLNSSNDNASKMKVAQVSSVGHNDADILEREMAKLSLKTGEHFDTAQKGDRTIIFSDSSDCPSLKEKGVDCIPTYVMR